jgi:hypothetical protein
MKRFFSKMMIAMAALVLSIGFAHAAKDMPDGTIGLDGVPLDDRHHGLDVYGPDAAYDNLDLPVSHGGPDDVGSEF